MFEVEKLYVCLVTMRGNKSATQAAGTTRQSSFAPVFDTKFDDDCKSSLRRIDQQIQIIYRIELYECTHLFDR
jgi:hypothetical protein